MDNPVVVYWVAVVAMGLMFYNPFVSTATKPSAIDEVRLDVAHGPVTAYLPASSMQTKIYAFDSLDLFPVDGARCEMEYQSLLSKDQTKVAKCLQGKWRVSDVPKNQ